MYTFACIGVCSVFFRSCSRCLLPEARLRFLNCPLSLRELSVSGMIGRPHRAEPRGKMKSGSALPFPSGTGMLGPISTGKFRKSALRSTRKPSGPAVHLPPVRVISAAICRKRGGMAPPSAVSVSFLPKGAPGRPLHSAIAWSAGGTDMGPTRVGERSDLRFPGSVRRKSGTISGILIFARR